MATECDEADLMAQHANALSEHYRAKVAARDAEIEKLRTALTQIMELGYHSLDPNVDKRLTELAREALSSE